MSDINNYLKVANTKGYVLTKFLDSKEQSELYNLAHKDYHISFFGGYHSENLERFRAYIQNKDYELIEPLDYLIDILKITLPTNHNITHRNVLGTLMSLGIKRDTIGDIIINNEEIYIFCIQEMSNYIISNLTSINHYLVSIELLDKQAINNIPKPLTIKKEINVSSLRIDNIISKTINISRTDSLNLIEKGLVFINHKECLNSSYNLKNNELISIRGYGRIKYLGLLRTTKKDRLVLEIEIFK